MIFTGFDGNACANAPGTINVDDIAANAIAIDRIAVADQPPRLSRKTRRMLDEVGQKADPGIGRMYFDDPLESDTASSIQSSFSTKRSACVAILSG